MWCSHGRDQGSQIRPLLGPANSARFFLGLHCLFTQWNQRVRSSILIMIVTSQKTAANGSPRSAPDSPWPQPRPRSREGEWRWLLAVELPLPCTSELSARLGLSVPLPSWIAVNAQHPCSYMLAIWAGAVWSYNLRFTFSRIIESCQNQMNTYRNYSLLWSMFNWQLYRQYS